MKVDNTTIANLREDYRANILTIKEANSNPLQQFKQWFQEALDRNIKEANAMINQGPGSVCVHNEANKSRQNRDNDDEAALLLVFQRCKVISSSSPGTLQNLASKDLATSNSKLITLCQTTRTGSEYLC